MYPAGELTLLAARKMALQVRIAERRGQCVEAGANLARPFALVDRGMELWRKISPALKVAGVPVLLMLVQKLAGRHPRLAKLAALLPLVMSVARSMPGMRASTPPQSG